MNPRVEEYLKACEERKRAQETGAANQQQSKEAEYRARVLMKAGLTEEIITECSQTEYRLASLINQVSREKQEDGWHYKIRKIVPIEVTDEEFAAIEKTVLLSNTSQSPTGMQAAGMQTPEKQVEEESRSAVFFTGLAWVLFIGGLILAIALAFQQVPSVSTNYYGRATTSYSTEFSFSLFLTTYSSFFIGGMFCLAAAELFKKLQTIVNLLRSRK